MGRAPCCDKIGLKKGPWTADEDQKLTSYINEHGHGSWRALPKKAGLLRCGKSCRLRWANYLRPDIKRGEFSASEEKTIIQLHALLGNRWSAIATHLPQRTDNEIKNYWNTHLKKRLLKMGIDPATHKPKTGLTSCNSSLVESPVNSHGSSSAVSHLIQWESARLEAEARLARESKQRAKGLWQPSASTPPWSSPKASRDVSSTLDYVDLMTPKQDYGCLMTLPTQKYGGMLGPKQDNEENGSCKALTATEVLNSLQNWEKSLQGQAGLMWPGSWRLSSAEGQESSCCSSPLDRLNHASPTSTLCSLDQSSKHQLAFNYPPSAQARKLSWSDNLFPNAHKPLNSFYDSSKPLSSANLCQVDGFQAVSGKVSGEISPSSLLCLQDLIQFDGYSMKREGNSTPALVSATNSSSLLSELELVSEDISSRKSASNISSCEISEEDYWNSMLADSPRQEQIDAIESIPF